MLSRLIPSTRSLFPRALKSSSSLQLFAQRSLVPSSTNALFRRSFSATAPTAPTTTTTATPAARSVYLTHEPLIKAFDELIVQSASWAAEKKAQVESEIKAAQKSGGDSAALAVTQKYLLQRTTFNDVVQKFGGWYPLLGLATVAGFSKELFLLNEEVLLATNFCFVVGMIYVNYADVILQQFYEARAAHAKQQKELRELEIDTNKVLIASYEKNPLVYSMLKELKSDYNTLFEKKQKVTFARQRVAAHQAVTKKLRDIHAKELEEASRIRAFIQKAATAYVLDKYAKLPAAQKSLTLDYAIDRFAGGKVDIKKDPVRQLYLEYFKNKEWAKTAQKK